MSPRTAALLLATAFLLPALAPLVGASTEPTPNGDVVVNGAFANPTPAGHPAKLYCGPHNPTPAEGPGRECSGQDAFVAYDWTAPDAALAGIRLVEDGIELRRVAGADTPFVQQHFNGTDAPDRLMSVFAVEITGRGLEAPASLRVELRAPNHPGVTTKTIKLPTEGATVRIPAAELGIATSEPIPVRSLRLWANDDLVLQRASLYATNGVESRNIHVANRGDDNLVGGTGAAYLSPGLDQKYTFTVGMADDAGNFLPTLDAWICVYTAEQSVADQGYPDNVPTACADAFLQPNDPAITKTREGDAFRFDIDAAAVRPAEGFSGAVSVYAIVKVDGSYDIETPDAAQEWKSGYYNLARVLADAADAGVALEYPFPTPVFVDADGDSMPDYLQPDEADHYAAIVTPLHGAATPAATLVTPTLDGFYEFEVEVYEYPSVHEVLAEGRPLQGSALALDARGVGFGLFDATLLLSGEAPDVGRDAVWTAEAADVAQVSGTKYLVRVPASEVETAGPLAAWAFYDVEGDHTRRTAYEGAFGPSDTAFDFYSSIQTGAKDLYFADLLRSHVTPIVLDAGSYTNDATLVVRKTGADDVTVLDGSLVVDAGADGKVSFAYAMALSEGRTRVPSEGGHGLAIYDAAGLASDRFQPGASRLAHAEWTGAGTLGSDGWYHVDVPASAFAHAKGPVGVWAYVDDATVSPVLSRSGWYNLLKETVAAVSTTAAERALYPPTPILVVDRATGLPAELVASLQGLPGVFSLHNPLVNPGFEADLLVEGVHDNADAYSAAMTSPPWFFRLDDKGTNQPTDPASTHEVVLGAGRTGDAALGVQYVAADAGKGLMLGQLLGVEDAGAGFLWHDATGIAFDLKSQFQPVTFVATVKYLDGETVKQQSIKFNTATSSLWQRLEGRFMQPVTGQLLGFYLSPSAPSSAYFLLDNVVVQGSRTVLGDTRTDLTDGYALVIEPDHLDGLTQAAVAGAAGDYYLTNFSVVSYANGAGEKVDLAEKAASFGLRTAELTPNLGTILRLRGDTATLTAVLPVADAPATPAAPWAWAGLGDAYQPFGNPAYTMQAASGYYSPVKNAAAGSSLADRLDYAGTPVAFGGAGGLSLATDQVIHLEGDAEDGYRVLVDAAMPWIETTTLTVSDGLAQRDFPVVLAADVANPVPGLVLTEAELGAVTLRTSDTLFARGATVVPGDVVASFDACRVSQLPVCAIAGALSVEDVRFTDTSVVPGNEPHAIAWSFGDGESADGESVTHAFDAPGTYEVTMTVTTLSGKTDTYTQAVAIGNRAPAVAGIDVSPAEIFVDSVVTAQARATDEDRGTLAYTWLLDGVEVPGATGRSVTLTSDLLLATTGATRLLKGDHALRVIVEDGQGGDAELAKTFTVGDRGASVTLPAVSVVGFPEATHALVGETIRVSGFATDSDDAIASVSYTLVSGAQTLTGAMSESMGLWSADVLPPQFGEYLVSLTATNAAGETVTGPAIPFEVRIDGAPHIVLEGPGFIEAFESATFSALGTEDPDGRGAVAYRWLVDGVEVSTAEGITFDAGPEDVGIHTIALEATDATGQTALLEQSLAVDDTLVLVVRVEGLGMQGHARAIVKVTDEQGRPVAGAQVWLTDTVTGTDVAGALPLMASGENLVTDENGVAVWEIPGVGPFQLPLEHELWVSVEAGSHEDSPMPGPETAETTVLYTPGVLP